MKDKLFEFFEIEKLILSITIVDLFKVGAYIFAIVNETYLQEIE